MKCIAECTAIKKKTKAKMFSSIEVGSQIRFSVPVKAVGSNNGRSYAAIIECENINTKEVTSLTFNMLGKILEYFDFEQKE